MKKPFLIFFLLVAMASGCKNTTTPDDHTLIPSAYKNSAWKSVTGEFDILGVHKDGSFVAIDTTPDAYSNMRVLFRSEGSSPSLLMWLDENGVPLLGDIDGNIFVFENYTGSTVDIGIIWKDGNIEILRGVSSTGTSIVGKTRLASGGSLSTMSSLAMPWASIFNVVGHGLSVGSCAISVAITLASGGIGWPLTVLGCGATIVGLLVEANVIDNSSIEASSTAIGTFASAVDCISGGSCWSFLTNSASAVLTVAEGERSTNSTIIDTTRAALQQQGGDVQVTLTWTNTADIDLWVTDPFGELIYWAHPSSASGGELDVDDRNGYGPENIFWPQGGAPTGTYIVDVDYYSGSGTADYSVLVQAFGRVRRFDGSISPDQTLRIVSFSEQALTTAGSYAMTSMPKAQKVPKK